MANTRPTTFDPIEPIPQLLGKTLRSAKATENALLLVADDGTEFSFAHEQDCCEDIEIESIDGELTDLVGSSLVMAEEALHFCTDEEVSEMKMESASWAFYKFATAKGYVTVRWLGTSNGCYSERATIEMSPPSGGSVFLACNKCRFSEMRPGFAGYDRWCIIEEPVRTASDHRCHQWEAGS